MRATKNTHTQRGERERERARERERDPGLAHLEGGDEGATEIDQLDAELHVVAVEICAWEAPLGLVLYKGEGGREEGAEKTKAERPRNA